MNKTQLNKLITSCLKEHELKVQLKKIVNEAIQEIKSEKELTLQEMIDTLDSEVKKSNKDYNITKDDAGYYNVNGCAPHIVKIKHMYNDRFNVTHFRNGTDRTRKVALQYEDLKTFVKEILNLKEQNRVTKSFNKIAQNTEFAEGKEQGKQETKEKVEDAVKKKDDLPDSQMKTVETIKRQSDNSTKGTKPDYTYPKQTNNKLKIKLPSKKQKPKKS
jgi:hypothetical protein